MIVRNITFGPRYIKQFEKLPEKVKEAAVKKESIFRNNPLHPSLRLHALKGKLEGFFSISVTLNYRILFKRKDNGDILFITIGKHDIYRSL